jgi:prepilin-type N-terminal cleavage/methylation domain-containing protein
LPKSTRPSEPEHAELGGDGFTLIEVLVVVVILGVLATVLAGAIVVVLRTSLTSPSTAERIDDAQVVQGLVTWLPQDVDSTPVAGFDVDPTALTGCDGPSDGKSLLKLTWSETVGGMVTFFRANYRHVTAGMEGRIVRVTCSGSAPANSVPADPLGPSTVIKVASQLAPLPPGWAPTQLPADVRVNPNASGTGADVMFKLETLTGKIVEVEAASKNPNQTLPPTTTAAPGTTVATTTTTPTTTSTTTVPPPDPSSTTSTSTSSTSTVVTTTTVPCVVTGGDIVEMSGTPNNGIVRIAPSGNNSGKLESDVVLRVSWTGGCQGLRLSYETGSVSLSPQNFTPGSPATVTLLGEPSGGTEIWNRGPHDLTVFSAAGTHATLALEVVKNNQAA